MNSSELATIAINTGLSVGTVHDLMKNGWKYHQVDGKPAIWLNPTTLLEKHSKSEPVIQTRILSPNQIVEAFNELARRAGKMDRWVVCNGEVSKIL